jgi:WD40 repeat protein
MIVLSLRGKIFTVAKDRLIKVIGTYFYGMLSSGVWQPNSDGVYIIDRPSEGFDRILECLETGKLNCNGLTDYEIDCVYGNLDYFLIPFTRIWDYSVVKKIENLTLYVYLQLSDQRLCGSTRDYRIFIYNMDTQIIETTLVGHKDEVRGIIQLEDGRLCSCSFDETIRLWNIGSGQCELCIEGYSVIQLLDGRLCSRSQDETVKIWNKDSGVCELSIHTGNNVYFLAQLRNGSICGSHSGGINVWSIATGVCEMTLSGHNRGWSQVVVIDEQRICVCLDSIMEVWNVSTCVYERTLAGHTNYVMDLILLLDGRICSVSYDGTARIWDTGTGACELSVHVSIGFPCKVVQLHDGRLVVSDCDRRVYIVE